MGKKTLCHQCPRKVARTADVRSPNRVAAARSSSASTSSPSPLTSSEAPALATSLAAIPVAVAPAMSEEVVKADDGVGEGAARRIPGQDRLKEESSSAAVVTATPGATVAPPVPVPSARGDEEVARRLFVELNREAIGIPGDGGLVVVSSDDENEIDWEALAAEDDQSVGSWSPPGS